MSAQVPSGKHPCWFQPGCLVFHLRTWAGYSIFLNLWSHQLLKTMRHTQVSSVNQWLKGFSHRPIILYLSSTISWQQAPDRLEMLGTGGSSQLLHNTYFSWVAICCHSHAENSTVPCGTVDSIYNKTKKRKNRAALTRSAWLTPAALFNIVVELLHAGSNLERAWWGKACDEESSSAFL